ncbi:SUKH-3 domain-containing protein [Herpetosiphon llansteffanensis]|uniref:SUKH-3 domain-containing protein n=1 Tax=Herpetosiphon llansteffanensis TaxID=2094568 RepID=UPI000D7CA908|nr:SUKH-3 domain-containing protein [Herpetosiphon llansteffanensis]
MFPSVLQMVMADANWKPAIDRDPTPWLDALATHHYPLFPAAEALLATYGGCAFTTTCWHDTAFELTDTLAGIFEWPASEIEISIDPYRAKALTEAKIWQTHPYILHTNLQLAPIGHVSYPTQSAASLFVLSNGCILQGQWTYNRLDWKLPSVPVLSMLGASLEQAIEKILYAGLLIMERTPDVIHEGHETHEA